MPIPNKYSKTNQLSEIKQRRVKGSEPHWSSFQIEKDQSTHKRTRSEIKIKLKKKKGNPRITTDTDIVFSFFPSFLL